MCRLDKFTNYAIDEANYSPLKYKLGAIIFKGGSILSRGYNYDTIHAEEHALKKLKPHQIEGADILVVRINTTGLAMAKPCKKCHSKLVENGIKRVFYSNNEGTIEIMRL